MKSWEGPSQNATLSAAVAAFAEVISLHRQGKMPQAELRCAELLRIHPRHAGAWHLRGLMALQAGEPRQGIEWIQRSLGLDPNQPAGYLNIGNYWLTQHQPGLALAGFDQALALEADYPLAWYNRGNALRELGRLEAAIASYDETLRRQPQHWQAANNRGLALLQLGRLDEAVAAFEGAIALAPTAGDPYNNLGAALLKLKLARRSLDCYDQACRLTPQDAESWCGRGNALLALNQTEDAAASYSRALQLAPEFTQALVNRCGALLALYRPLEALRDGEQALRRTPDSVLAFNNTGNALSALGRIEEALACYDQALHRQPVATDTIHNRAVVLRKLMRFRESAQGYEELLQVSPDQDYALGNLFQLRMDGCDWNDYASLVRRLHEALPKRERVINPMSLLLIDSPSAQRRLAQDFASTECPPDDSLGPCPARTRSALEKIRVAYVSADLREHPVSYLLLGALECHDRERFEIMAISLAPAESTPFGRRVQQAFDRFIDVSGHSDRQIARLMRELQVDIAVDLMGFTEAHRLGIFAHRAAPVQAAFLGYAGTLGVPYMDYLLADEVVLPKDHEHHFTEHVVRLPHCFLPAVAQVMATPPNRKAAGLADGLVFCAFTNACKINPPIFELWMRVLRDTPDSVLWLRSTSAEPRANLEAEARRQGIDPARLVFAARVAGMSEHLARLSCADLCLDTFPYNGHSTTCDALWAGVPVITCAGQSFASRVAASALTAIGLPELITRNLADYEHQVLELARHPEKLRGFRSRLAANRLRMPLFQTERYTRHLEGVYEFMWARPT